MGSPDIAIKRYQVVVFIDSCFWHGCPIHFQTPKTNTEFWVNKIARNKARDELVTAHYKSSDWKILRIWEHELKDDFQSAVERISDFIRGGSRSDR